MLLKKVLPVLLVLALSACSSAKATKVTLTMKEFGFEPNTITVTAGTPVELTLVNTGAIEHDFVIEIIPVSDVSVEGSGMTEHSMSGDHPEYDLHAATLAGETSVIKFTPTEPGTYQIICSVPGHLDAGMTGELIVK